MPRNAPVAQAIIDGAAAATRLFEEICNRVERAVEIQAVVLARIDEYACVDEHSFVDIDLAAVRRRNDLLDRQAVFLREFPVALVVPGHGHDSARAVTHEHEVRDPQRHLFAGQRVNRRDAERHALLFHRLERRLGGIGLLAVFDECRNSGLSAAALVASGCSAATAM